MHKFSLETRTEGRADMGRQIRLVLTATTFREGKWRLRETVQSQAANKGLS